MTRGAATVLGMVLLAPVPVWAQCVSSSRAPGQESLYDAVQLIASGLPAGLLDEFRSAYGAWNSGQCKSIWYSFPNFQETAQGAGRTVTLQVVSGFNPNNNQACGNFAAVTNTITVFEWARTSDGTQTVPCQRSDIFLDNLTHELGHLLGLQDQGTSCSGYIMSQAALTSSGAYIDRTLRQSECDKVDETNYTPLEQEEAECDTQCQHCEPPGSECSPIVLDYDDGGFLFTGLDEPVLFDIDASGVAEHVGWPVAASQDLFLARDRNGNGRIDNGTELFGDATPFLNGNPAQNGYQVLFELDLVLGNGNGYLDRADLVYSRLLLWHDRNHDGISERGELRTLKEAGVEAIAVNYRVSAYNDENGNGFRYRSHAYLINELGERVKIETADVLLVSDGQ
jgi:hypothetical protein